MKTPALWLMLLLIGFPQISETIYSPALPNIAHSLASSNTIVQWTLSIYFIGFALGVFTWGWASDHIGRRRAMLYGLVLYFIASLLCLKVSNIYQLLLLRCIQGLGASCGSVVTQAIAREALPETERHHFFSLSGFVLAFAITLGPFIGGYLTQWFSWSANFAFLASMGFILFLLSTAKLPETHQARTHKDPTSFSSICKKMLSDKHILMSTWVIGALNGLLFSYYAEAPFLFIQLIQLTPSEFGWLGIFIALAALGGTLTAKKLIAKMELSRIVQIGLTLMLTSSLFFVLVAYFAPLSFHHKIMSCILILLPMIGLIFAAFGFLIPITLSQALLSYKNTLGRAGAIFGLSYYALVSIFTWIMGAIHNGQAWPMPVYFLCLSVSIAFTTRWGTAFQSQQA
jgi:Bcr/CflA subfamily drug resistance transporter